MLNAIIMIFCKAALKQRVLWKHYTNKFGLTWIWLEHFWGRGLLFVWPIENRGVFRKPIWKQSFMQFFFRFSSNCCFVMTVINSKGTSSDWGRVNIMCTKTYTWIQACVFRSVWFMYCVEYVSGQITTLAVGRLNVRAVENCWSSSL